MVQPTPPPPSAAPVPPPTRRGMLRIGRIAGVPVYLTFSWLVLAVLVTIGYGSYVGGGGHRAELNYLFGAGIVVCLVVSVLLHEVGHALTARHYGVGVRAITLELLGGFTEMDRDAPTPRSEAAIALAGPAVSLVLALIGGALLPVTTRGTILGDFVVQFAFSNAIVAVFNGLPGLPLDGGRALRALVWRLTRDPYRADVVAGWAGRVIAVATLGATVAVFVLGAVLAPFGLVFLALVALTLWNGATASIRGAQVKARLPHLQAGRLARPLVAVPTGLPLAEALRRRDELATEAIAAHVAAGGNAASLTPAHRPVIGILDSFNRVVALVNNQAVTAVPVERRPWLPVDAVAVAVVPTAHITAESTGAAMIEAIQANPGDDLLVTLGDDVIGVLRATDLIAELGSRRGG